MGLLLNFVLVVLGGWVALWYLATQPLRPSLPVGDPPAVDPAELARVVRTLSEDLAPRNPTPRDLAPSAAFIERELHRHTPRVETRAFTLGAEPFANVVASFGPESAERIVVGAHYDAFGGHPGADDNASGVAGLIALARLLAAEPPTMAVEVIAYALEEPPFFGTDAMGSAHHAAHLKRTGARVRLVIVLEMIGYFDPMPGSQAYPLPLMRWWYPSRGDFIAVVGDLGQMRTVRNVKRSFRRASALPVYSINAPRGIPGIDLSDHLSYWRHGYPAVMVSSHGDRHGLLSQWGLS
jgi:hypothetical protein